MCPWGKREQQNKHVIHPTIHPSIHHLPTPHPPTPKQNTNPTHHGDLRLALGRDVPQVLAVPREALVHGVARGRRREHGHLLEDVGDGGQQQESRGEEVGQHLQPRPRREEQGGAEAPALGVRVEAPAHLGGPHDAPQLPEGVLLDPVERRRQAHALRLEPQGQQERARAKDADRGRDETLEDAPLGVAVVVRRDRLWQEALPQVPLHPPPQPVARRPVLHDREAPPRPVPGHAVPPHPVVGLHKRRP